MIGRVVEVAEDNRYLSVERGFLLVSDGQREVGRVPLDDIAALIATAHGLRYSNNLLVELARRGTPFVLCAANHSPVAMLWPIDGHHEQGARMDAQLAAGRPLGKRLWQQIVRAKLAQQAAVLAALGQPDAPVRALMPRVRSGDPDNIEAQAARRYWPRLFGEAFRRDRDAPDANRLLNYGYAVLRAATARAVMAAGLHPTLGIHHRNGQNAMRLVDDLMEPFRPLIDYAVVQIARGGETVLDAATKREIVHLLYGELATVAGSTPLATCLGRLATSLALVYQGQRIDLDLPQPATPTELAALLPQPRRSDQC